MTKRTQLNFQVTEDQMARISNAVSQTSETTSDFCRNAIMGRVESIENTIITPEVANSLVLRYANTLASSYASSPVNPLEDTIKKLSGG